MSIKLANDEKIVKSYEYAGVSKLGVGNSAGTTKKLIVTNKRIIHEAITTGMGTDCVSTQEIPVKSAKYVNVYYGMKSYAALLVMGFVFVLIALFSLITSAAGGDMEVGAPLFLVFFIFGVIFMILWKFVKNYVVTCTILTDSIIMPTMHLSSRAGSTLTRRARGALAAADNTATINVQVKVNKDVAKAMAEELGAVLHDVIDGHYDDVAVTED